jgi:hypothetical protein
MGDDDFLAACGIPDDPFRRRVAVKSREAIAKLAGVPRETILPEHSSRFDLIELPYWDSLDWLGYVFEVERLLKGAVVIPNPIEEAHRAAGYMAILRVKHLVKATSLAAGKTEMGKRRRKNIVR